MNSRPLSQLTTKDLQLLLDSLLNSPVDNREERWRVNRLAESLNIPTLGAKSSMDLSRIKSKIECEQNFYSFVQTAFKIVEPGTDFIGNWHIEAICNHFDAMLMGKIKNLIINQPPGTMKSFVSSVLWPAWVWIHDPTQGFMYASYDQQLSTRDSIRCRALIESEWYRDSWGDRFWLTSDQNQKTRFNNNHGGFRIATSTKGRGMGEHPHWLCLTGETRVKTRFGEIPIADIVEKSLGVQVASMNHETGRIEYKSISAYKSNGAAEICEVKLSNGTTIRCTPDHEIWTSTRGYIQAIDLEKSDVLPSTPADDVSYATIRKSEFLLKDGRRSSRSSQFADFLDHRRGGLGISWDLEFPVRSDQPLGDVLPSLASSDIADRDLGDFEPPADGFDSFHRDVDILDLRLRELGLSLIHAFRDDSMTAGIVNILLRVAPSKIEKGIIDRDSIQMSSVIAGGSLPDEGPKNLNMDMPHGGLSIGSSAEAIIPLAEGQFDRSLDLSIDAAFVPSIGPDMPSVTDEVVLGSDDIFPVSIRVLKFHEDTFCLSVEDNQNFIICSNGKGYVVSNCIDDPNNTAKSASEADRSKAYAHHANSFLTKPVDFAKFQQMCRDLNLYWTVWNQPPVSGSESRHAA